MCVRQAKQKKIILLERFWNKDSWKLIYKKQMLAANNLLKAYESQAILNALNQKNYQWVSSLWYKELQSLISQEQDKINMEKEQLEKIRAKEMQQEIDKLKEEYMLPKETIVTPFGSKKKILD